MLYELVHSFIDFKRRKTDNCSRNSILISDISCWNCWEELKPVISPHSFSPLHRVYALSFLWVPKHLSHFLKSRYIYSLVGNIETIKSLPLSIFNVLEYIPIGKYSHNILKGSWLLSRIQLVGCFGCLFIIGSSWMVWKKSR